MKIMTTQRENNFKKMKGPKQAVPRDYMILFVDAEPIINIDPPPCPIETRPDWYGCNERGFVSRL